MKVNFFKSPLLVVAADKMEECASVKYTSALENLV